MNTTLNLQIDHAMWAIVAGSLRNSELGRLFQALAARMGGHDVPPGLLNTSGLRLAFAQLSAPIDESLERLATNRANGARGGRPRKRTEPAETSARTESVGFQSVQDKKTKKEDLSPTPPIEEKNKKTELEKTPSLDACAHERKPPVTVPGLDQLQEQMLQEQPWLDQLCMSRHISKEDMTTYIMDFIAYLKDQDARETLPHAKAHFVNQLPYILKIHTTNRNHEKHNETHQQFIANPVARRQFERESRRQDVCRALSDLAAHGKQPAVVPF